MGSHLLKHDELSEVRIQFHQLLHRLLWCTPRRRRQGRGQLFVGIIVLPCKDLTELGILCQRSTACGEP